MDRDWPGRVNPTKWDDLGDGTARCRSCKLVGKPGLEPDPCIGELPGATSACCGHGGSHFYVTFDVGGDHIAFPPYGFHSSFAEGQAFRWSEYVELVELAGGWPTVEVEDDATPEEITQAFKEKYPTLYEVIPESPVGEAGVIEGMVEDYRRELEPVPFGLGWWYRHFAHRKHIPESVEETNG